MGISILELVLRRLREEQFNADVAYPGQKFPRVTDTVAAVHIEQVDRAGMTVTVEVNVICPASMGGTTCELEALRATEVLRGAGAVCIQNGCTYDGIAQMYVVQVLATFTGATDAESYVRGPGFYVYVNDLLLINAIAVSEEEQTGVQAEYVMGESQPGGISTGGSTWTIRVEELIPSGYPELTEMGESFTLTVMTDRKTEVYSGCRWTSIQREYTREGLRRVRNGIALGREEE